jgi:molybdate transport system regulatory protein
MVTVRYKLWIEKEGRSVFGDGRAQLLEAIEETASLSAAARRVGIPFRTAWKHVNEMEEAYGKKLLERHAGGPTGGGCRLTPEGRALLHRYLRFRAGIERLIEERFRRVWSARRRARPAQSTRAEDRKLR